MASIKKNTPKNIFVLGLDDFNLKELEMVSEADRYNYQTLLTFDDIFGPDAPGIEKLLEQAREILDNYDKSIDAIIGYWDFPVTSMVPWLCELYNLPAPSFESVIKCEHKYWSRVEQSRAVDEYPGFDGVDPFDANAIEKLTLKYPFWLKPIKATASQLGFLIRSREDFMNAQEIIQKKITGFSGPFNFLLSELSLPDDMKHIDGSYCIAEEIIKGSQCTASGYVHNKKVTVYGIVDSVNYPDSSSFFRYEYPSTLPKKVRRHIAEDSKKVIGQIGLDNSTFNIEYFYDETFDRIWILEINPRMSQSHSYLYRKVDGETNFKIMIDLALGKIPQFPQEKGQFNCAAKFFLRRFYDGKVKKVPAESEIEEIVRAFPGSRIHINVSEGNRLSELARQDSYSFDLAHLFLGAADHYELMDKYHRCREMLDFQFEE